MSLVRLRAKDDVECRRIGLFTPTEFVWTDAPEATRAVIAALAPDDRAAVVLDENWLRSRLRMALGIESRDGVTDLADDVWRLRDARREPVLLSRSLARLWAEPAIFDRVRCLDQASGSSHRSLPTPGARRFRPASSGCRWKSDSRSTAEGSRTLLVRP